VYPCSASPVPVSGGLQFTAIRVGTYTTCGIATDARVYCWGANGVGQLGNESLTNTSSPSRISGQD
jgi:alpha-tubulin suppressor-like RCC1 family protein